MSIIDEDNDTLEANDDNDAPPDTAHFAPEKREELVKNTKRRSEETKNVSLGINSENKSGSKNVKMYFGQDALDDLFKQMSQSDEDKFVIQKVQGGLIKWIEGKKIGNAQYGDVV